MLKRKLLALLAALLLLNGAAAESAEPCFVRIIVAGCGTIIAELYPETAPLTVANFRKLAESGFYDGLTFHRIISGFMIQGGDPNGNGTGGSPEKIWGEFSANGFENTLKHERGVLSMARSSDMNSASSQFFIMHEDAPHLDGSYAAFGRVLAGMHVVDLLCMNTPVQDQNGTVSPADQPVISSVQLITAAEAELAVRAEAANGQQGMFRDPYSGLSCALPAGWRLASVSQGLSTFQNEAGDTFFIQLIADYWGSLTASRRAQLSEAGYSRAALTTDSFGKDQFAAMLRVEADMLASAEVGGLPFYTLQTADRLWYLGAAGGRVLALYAPAGAGQEALRETIGQLRWAEE